MTILNALVGHYDRLKIAGDVPNYGYSRERISYAVVLSRSGKLIDVMSLLETSGAKPRPSLRSVPRPAPDRRGLRKVANFLWDKTAYAFGRTRERQTKQVVDAELEHAEFRKFHDRLLGDSADPGLLALRGFLDSWEPERYDTLRYADDMLDTNIVFRLDGEQSFLHDRPAARRIWQDHLAGHEGAATSCLVTGEKAPSARLHPPVKGVGGAQSSGAAIVSFNLDAFTSFGKDQGANAPVSESAAFAYTTALNHMLADGRQRIRIGDATTVFWAEAAGDAEAAAAAEDLFSVLADPPTDEDEAVKVSDKLRKVSEGRPLPEVQPEVDENTHFYVLGLSPNASRLSIRFWFQDSIGRIARRIAQHWQDLYIEPTPWKTPPAAWRLLRETASQGKADNIPPAHGGALMRAILIGGRYPQSLMTAVNGRIRADKNVTGMRAAICKACLARDYRLGFEKEDVPVSLNREEKNSAYRLGRLFAVYENVQHAALPKTNTTIKDRYFGAASATPASVFPLLERKSAHHLASLRKGDKGGLAHWFESEIGSILDGIATAFPRSLRLEDQGRFAIGYHHQKFFKASSSSASEEGTKIADAAIHSED